MFTDMRTRFEAKVDRNGPMSVLGTRCHLWTGSLQKNGYGRFWAGPGVVYAHRAAYLLYVGPIPEDPPGCDARDMLQVDHLCFRRACVNPEHLEIVRAEENWHRRLRLVP